ncbi:hypothetical protein ACUY19_06930 [Corynebacterium kroppenstedtii]
MNNPNLLRIKTLKGFSPPPITARRLCDGHPEWTTDSDKEDKAPDFIAICHQCPALTQCEAYLKAHEDAGVPVFGVVAGRTYQGKKET